MSTNVNKVVLAYSGGLDTSVILRWLIETYRCEVVAFCADVGQGEELDPVEPKARKTGASEVVIDDLREEFVRDYVFPMLRGAAIYEGTYLLGTSIARPLIAKRQIEVARETGADAVAHGATGKGNDQVRFELAFAALDPSIRIIAPWRDPKWQLTSRTKMLDFASRHGIDVPVTAEKPYSMDRNFLHVSYEGGILEDPWNPPKEDMFLLTRSLKDAPDEPEEITIDYREGNPVAVNGEELSPAALLAKLNGLGGKHGIGRVDIVENRYVGMKSRGVYETPGGTVLHAAHRAVESLTLDREAMHLRDSWISRYAELIYNGYWFSPEREMLQAGIDEGQKSVTGTARLKLYKGNAVVTGRKSPVSLYRPDIASFEDATAYDQADATGFIRLNSLRLRTRAGVSKKD